MTFDVLEPLAYGFFQKALIAGVLASIACGIIGTYVVVKRMVFIAGGVSHTAFGGVGIATYLGANPLLGAALFSVASALGIGVIHEKTKQREDTLIGAMWSAGMAIGIIFIYFTPGYTADLFSYLFGNILLILPEDLLLAGVLDALIIALVAVYYRQLLALTFDEEYARTLNINTTRLYLLLLVCIGLTVVILIRIVGVILLIALLSLPAATAGIYTNDMKRMMLAATALSLIYTTAGIFASYYVDLPTSAAIILLAALAYVAALAARKAIPTPN